MKYSINYKLVENMHDFSGLDNIVKAVVIEQDIPKLLKIRDIINTSIPSVKAVQSNWNCIDINSKSVSKGNAILEYAKIEVLSQKKLLLLVIVKMIFLCLKKLVLV